MVSQSQWCNSNQLLTTEKILDELSWAFPVYLVFTLIIAEYLSCFWGDGYFNFLTCMSRWMIRYQKFENLYCGFILYDVLKWHNPTPFLYNRPINCIFLESSKYQYKIRQKFHILLMNFFMQKIFNYSKECCVLQIDKNIQNMKWKYQKKKLCFLQNIDEEKFFLFRIICIRKSESSSCIITNLYVFHKTHFGIECWQYFLKMIVFIDFIWD